MSAFPKLNSRRNRPPRLFGQAPRGLGVAIRGAPQPARLVFAGDHRCVGASVSASLESARAAAESKSDFLRLAEATIKRRFLLSRVTDSGEEGDRSQSETTAHDAARSSEAGRGHRCKSRPAPAYAGPGGGGSSSPFRVSIGGRSGPTSSVGLLRPPSAAHDLRWIF